MRLLAIRGENLASLGEFEIDFDAEPLRSAGLFAISGPTGAGKSTLLDAVCLALYNAAPRLDGVEKAAGTVELKGDDARSILRHGAGSAFAEVDFVGADGRAYRAQWTVNRARKRAAGALQTQKRALSDRATGEVLCEGLAPMAAEMPRVIGLSFDQFRRAALLAQGDFDAFLSARAADRALLLERITGAEIYAKLSQAAHRRARDARAEIKALEERLGEAQALGPDARAAAEAAEAHAAARCAAAAALLDEIGAAAAWNEERAALHAKTIAAANALDAAETAARETRQAAARRAKASILAVARAIARHRDWLDAAPDATRLADRADDVLGALDRLSVLRATSRKAADAVAASQRRSQQLKDDAVAQAHREADAAAAREAAEAQIAPLRDQVATVDQDALAASHAALNAALRTLDGLQQSEQAGRAAKEQLQQAQSAADAAAARRDAAQEDLVRVEAGLAPLRAAAATAEAEARRWELTSGDAAKRLRAALEPGRPCPVCGSTDHADLGAEAFLNEERRRALELVAARREEAQQAVAQLAQLTERRDGALAEVAAATARAASSAAALQSARDAWRDGMSALAAGADAATTPILPPAIATAIAELDRAGRKPDAVRALRADVDAAVASVEETQASARRMAKALQDATEAARRAVETLQDAAAATARLREAALAADAEVERARLALEQAQEAVHDAEARLDDWLAGLAPDWRDAPAIALRGRIEELAREVADHRRGLQQAEALAPSLETHLEEMIASLSVDERDALDADVAALGDPFDAARLAQEPRDARTRLRAAEQRLTESQSGQRYAAAAFQTHDEHAPTPSEPLMALWREQDWPTFASVAQVSSADWSRALAAARAADAAAAADRKDAEWALREDDRKRAEQAQLQQTLTARTAAAHVWLQLDELIGHAKGDVFRRYAQAITLRQLVALANRHLETLHPRYALAVAPGEDNALGLVAIDRDMGDEMRGVQNLSGGERFLASLALALGLSALSSESGVQVESLFIDEGFGALDAESLSLAISALEALQATGRRIGVISHIEEVKERIATQIQVEPVGAGRSKISIVTM